MKLADFFYFRSENREARVELSSLHIKFLPGVGEKRAALLAQELGIQSYEDMLYHVPYRYVDRSRVYTIAELTLQMPYIQVRARVRGFTLAGEGRQQRATAIAYDGTGELELVWFKGFKYLASQLSPDKEYLIFGKPTVFNQRLNIVHPEIDPYDPSAARSPLGFQAVYPTTEKMKKAYLNSRFISRLQANIFRSITGKLEETLPAWFIQQHGLLYLHDALYNIHFPSDPDTLRRAQYRLKFEELFYIQLDILRRKYNRKQAFVGHRFATVGTYFNDFYFHHLPFPLTDAQKRVLREIRSDCGSGRQMNRLLQGDVGSGKTIVALMAMLLALDNGCQACIMAPTEILATQHYQTLSSLLKDTPVSVGLLTGSTRKRDRDVLHADLLAGRLHILVGTHALLEDNVLFKNIGLVVIDEQHRFGVAQRARLWQKNTVPPHVLVMTATPIPRTLAMTLYGDLDVSVIDQLPPGRKPVTTLHAYEAKRPSVYQFIRRELDKGRQAYIVYPLISESEKMDYRDLEQGFQQATAYFLPLGYRVGILHGRMKPAEKDEQMRRFVDGETRLLVATTVIEVGVNVPNASVMLIESAQRFGLSQLHQLRGRVGRGADQSYCILMTSYKLSNESRARIDTMTSTNDGFEIAEVDLRLRGPGDVEGTQQSGLTCNLRVANLARDTAILNAASSAAADILAADPTLQQPDNAVFAARLRHLFNTALNWRYIS